MEKQCAICGGTFKIKPSHYDKVFCCSKNCSKEYPLLKVIERLEEQKGIELNKYLHEEYTINKRSYRWLIENLKINNRTVKRLLEKFEIPVRKGSEAIKTQWNDNEERRFQAKETLRENVEKLKEHPKALSERDIHERLEGTDFIFVERAGTRKIKIKCVRCNSEFIKTPDYLLHSDKCFECNKGSKGETLIKKILENNNIDFKQQLRIEGCKKKNLLPFDFGIYKDGALVFLVEYDGKQHFNPLFNFGSSKEIFYDIRKSDVIKTSYCINNGIPLLRIKHTDDVERKLLNAIKLVM